MTQERGPRNFQGIDSLPTIYHPHPGEATRGTLDNWLWRRMYEADPTPGLGIPYFDVVHGAIFEARETGSNLDTRIAQVSAVLVGDIHSKVVSGSETEADMTALNNLAFIVPDLPQSYARGAIADTIKPLATELVTRQDYLPRRVGVRLLDTPNPLTTRSRR